MKKHVSKLLAAILSAMFILSMGIAVSAANNVNVQPVLKSIALQNDANKKVSSYTLFVNAADAELSMDLNPTTVPVAYKGPGEPEVVSKESSVTLNVVPALKAGAVEDVDFYFSTSNRSVATVAKDATDPAHKKITITAKGVGKATITVWDVQNPKITAKITVTVKSLVEGITFNDENVAVSSAPEYDYEVTVAKGGTLTMDPVVFPANAASKGLKYTVSKALNNVWDEDPELTTGAKQTAVKDKTVIAAVAGGKVTGKAVGECYVVVNAADQSYRYFKSEADFAKKKYTTGAFGASYVVKVNVVPADAKDKPSAVTVTGGWWNTDKVAQGGKGPIGAADYGILYATSKQAANKQLSVNLLTNRKNNTFDLGSSISVVEDDPENPVTNAGRYKLRYTTSNAKAAVVDRNGKVTAVGNGKAVIKVFAKDGSTKALAQLTVNVTTNVEAIALPVTELNALIGKSYKLGASVAKTATVKAIKYEVVESYYAGSTTPLTVAEMKNAKTAVVTVSSGTVAAKKAGFARIRVWLENKDKTVVERFVTVTVTNPVGTLAARVEGYTANKQGVSGATAITLYSFGEYDRARVVAVVSGANKMAATDPAVFFTTSNPAVAFVDDYDKEPALITAENIGSFAWTGIKMAVGDYVIVRNVVAAGNGTATITATAADGSGKKAAFKVTVKTQVNGIVAAGANYGVNGSMPEPTEFKDGETVTDWYDVKWYTVTIASGSSANLLAAVNDNASNKGLAYKFVPAKLYMLTEGDELYIDDETGKPVQVTDKKGKPVFASGISVSNGTVKATAAATRSFYRVTDENDVGHDERNNALGSDYVGYVEISSKDATTAPKQNAYVARVLVKVMPEKVYIDNRDSRLTVVGVACDEDAQGDQEGEEYCTTTYITLKVGQTAQVGTALAPHITERALTWKSATAGVATVSNTGLITAKKVGVTSITVRPTSQEMKQEGKKKVPVIPTEELTHTIMVRVVPNDATYRTTTGTTLKTELDREDRSWIGVKTTYDAKKFTLNAEILNPNQEFSFTQYTQNDFDRDETKAEAEAAYLRLFKDEYESIEVRKAGEDKTVTITPDGTSVAVVTVDDGRAYKVVREGKDRVTVTSLTSGKQYVVERLASNSRTVVITKPDGTQDERDYTGREDLMIEAMGYVVTKLGLGIGADYRYLVDLTGLQLTITLNSRDSAKVEEYPGKSFGSVTYQSEFYLNFTTKDAVMLAAYQERMAEVVENFNNRQNIPDDMSNISASYNAENNSVTFHIADTADATLDKYKNAVQSFFGEACNQQNEGRGVFHKAVSFTPVVKGESLATFASVGELENFLNGELFDRLGGQKLSESEKKTDANGAERTLALVIVYDYNGIMFTQTLTFVLDFTEIVGQPPMNAEGEEPAEDEEPVEGEEPVEDEEPVEGEEPVETPEEPEVPAEPEQPAEEPEVPAEPEQPAEESEVPAEPEQPAEEPEVPAESEEPVEEPTEDAVPEEPAEGEVEAAEEAPVEPVVEADPVEEPVEPAVEADAA